MREKGEILVSETFSYRPLKSLIGERIFMVLNIEKKFVIVRVRHFGRQDTVFLLCCGMQYSLSTRWKTLCSLTNGKGLRDKWIARVKRE